MIARADNRGLGIQSWEFYRHMKPDRTLVIDMGAYSPYGNHLHRYPDARVAQWDGALDLAAIRWLIDGSDVIWTAETPYDYRLIELARHSGVRTVIQANWEFFLWNRQADLPRPDLFLAPSPWHLGDWPQNTIEFPSPVARDRLPFQLRTQARRFLHVAGHRAVADRAGSSLVFSAAARIQRGKLRVRSQSPMPSLAWQRLARRGVVFDVLDVEDYWDVYADGDVLVAPRRYGGQSLPMLEALSVGMPVISLDVEPQRRFLPRESLIPGRHPRRIRVQSGEIEVWTASPRDLAEKIHELHDDAALVERLSKQADEIAEAYAWHRLAEPYQRLLADV